MTVQTPAEATEALLDEILELELKQGTENALTGLLENALALLGVANDATTINMLEAMIQKLEGLKSSGNQISEEDATALQADLQAIIDGLVAE